MKHLNTIISIFFIALFSTASIADELLKLENLNPNDIPEYGENVVVVQDEEYNLKGIQGVADVKGKIEIPIALSSSDFEFTLEGIFRLNSPSISVFFTLGEQSIFFKINGSGVINLGNDDNNTSMAWQSRAKNQVRLTINNGVASIYVNEVFYKKITLSEDRQNTLYNKVIITDIHDSTSIFSLNLTNGIAGSSTEAAELSGDLVNLQIPRVNFNAADGVKPLWADLKLYPNAEGKILFEVVDFGDYPKK
jgi:hypothetical protein